MNNISKYFKIGMVLALALGISKGLNYEVFIANSPQIRPHLGMFIASQVTNLNVSTRYNLANLIHSLPEDKLKNFQLQPIAKGVYAKSNENKSYTIIKSGEVEWERYTFDINGKQVVIDVPRGQTPPTKDEVEKDF